METIDYSKPENQVGGGYCKEEKVESQEELNKIFEELGFKNSEYIESIKGSDLLNENSDDLLKMTIRTHKGINIESIEKFKKD